MFLTWSLRVLLVFAGVALGFFETAPEARGAIAGGIIAVSVVVLELALRRVQLIRVVLVLLGILTGLALGHVVDVLVSEIGAPQVLEPWSHFSLLVKILLAYLGASLVASRAQTLSSADAKALSALARGQSENLYVLDAPLLIDGRIYDLLKTGFLHHATLVVSKFVVDELQRLSEDPDGFKRTRGQRGLKVLSDIQEDGHAEIRSVENDYSDISDIAEKTVKLAQDLKAKVLTASASNNINPATASLMLNIHDLTNALKPVVLPGEGIHVYLIKEGKEKDQGVGYLDDGTMVVVEGGRGFLGRRVEATVSSVLQTSAGKMVFTRLRNHRE